jgi:hypothetical protein
MKKVNWLLEKNLFDTECEMTQIIKDMGMTVKLIEYSPYDFNEIYNLFDENECVIFYGSIQLAKVLRREVSWIPGVYLSEKSLECTSYYPSFGNNLLHHNYIMIPFGDLIRQKDFLFTSLNSHRLFLRPNSNMKNFTGILLNKQNYEDGIKLASFYGIDDNLLCLVSAAKDILYEWRFVIVDNKVVSGSLYRDWTNGGELDDSQTKDFVLLNSVSSEKYCDDSDAIDFANSLAHLYTRDRCWTMDIARCANGEYKVIEIGSFSCAGLYSNDLKSVVTEVSKAALNEWVEYNEEI